jgi:hypothetical protein
VSTRLMLAGVVMFLMGGAPAASQDGEPQSGATLKNYTDHRLETFGADLIPLFQPWPGPECRRAYRTRCPRNAELPERFYCRNTQVPYHEAQEDIFIPNFPRISVVLDCPSEADRMCQDARTRYCP